MAYKGSDLSPDFKTWFRAEKARITKALKAKGCTNLVFDYGFYYFSAFFTDANGQAWYMNSCDVRTGYDGVYRYQGGQFYYRTVTSYKDYRGGGNRYQNANDLENWPELDAAMRNSMAEGIQTEKWEAFDEGAANKVVNG